MSQLLDPFLHHPNLRDKISDPLNSFFRTFDIHEFIKERPEAGLTLNDVYSKEVREESRLNALSGRIDQDLYVFAYGSLMWDPAFRFSEVRKARLLNYSRRFILKDTGGARGTEERPGLMAALDVGDACDGLLFKIAQAHVDEETEILWRREMVGPAYRPVFVDIEINDHIYSALTFVADHSAEVICGNLTWDQQIEYLSTGTGFLGSSLDYLTNIAQQFDCLGIADEHVTDLLNATKTYLDKQP